MSCKFANRIENMQASEIREILKLTQKPEVISFAGGLPAPELFPTQEIAKLTQEIIAKDGVQVLQYATTEGWAPLRKKIAARMNNKLNTNVVADNILITTGSQQGLDFTGKLFLDEGDIVLCESPSYLGAINAFKAYSPKFIEVATDEQGLIPESLEEILANNTKVKFLYAIPDFQNPTGITWSLERRIKIVEICNRHNLPIIEDNPYGELRYEGEILPSLMSLDKNKQVVFLGTFSKTFCPGLRIGWVAGFDSLIENYITIKQSADLHTSTLDQRIVDAYMDSYDFDAHIANLCNLYRRRRDTILQAMDEYMPPQISYTRPNGGLFLWVTMPKHINSRDVFLECVAENVAFVPGDSFYPSTPQFNCMRINYSNMPEERIIEGIKRLATVLKNFVN